MGHSGAGKSTMAAWFLDRGYRVLADDVCVVTMDEPAAARPSRHSAAAPLARSASRSAAAPWTITSLPSTTWTSSMCRRPGRRRVRPIPLDHVYLLRKAERGSAGSGGSSGVEAVDALVANTYRGGYVTRWAARKRHLTSCLELVRQGAGLRASRVWGFDDYDEQAGPARRARAAS
jgi:hypothetical protein